MRCAMLLGLAAASVSSASVINGFVRRQNSGPACAMNCILNTRTGDCEQDTCIRASCTDADISEAKAAALEACRFFATASTATPSGDTDPFSFFNSFISVAREAQTLSPRPSTPSAGPMLPPGAIAGITIGVLTIVAILVGALLCVRRRRAHPDTQAATEPLNGHEEGTGEVREVNMHSAAISTQAWAPAPLSTKRSAMLERQGLSTPSRLPVDVVQHHSNSTPVLSSLPEVPLPVLEDEREAMQRRFELLQQQVDALARNQVRSDASDAGVPPAYGQ